MLFQIISKKYGNKFIRIDTDDLNKIKKFNWVIHPKDKKFYISTKMKIKGKQKNIQLHRFIMNIYNPNIFVDHKNGNTFDVRKSNLRFCNQYQNRHNSKIRKDNSSGYKGVYWHKNNNKWCCRIGCNNRKIFLGYFDNKIDAAKTYNKAALKYHGEFARINNCQK
jgi:hypothetical protein